MADASILVGDVRERLAELDDGSVRCCVTSPPYWGLRDYGVDGQIGLEQTIGEYLENMLEVFRSVWRVLANDGTLWLNLGDSYAGAPGGYQGKNGQRASRTFTARIPHRKAGDNLKPKDLVGVPWRVAFALQADGWYLRSDIVWSKPNPMPESVTDRPTKAHEYVFLLTKSPRYYYDAASIQERVTGGAHARGHGVNPKSTRSGLKTKQNASFSKAVRDTVDFRNKRSVWRVAPQPYGDAHFAVMPEALVEPCILAGSEPHDTVLDPFSGTGTVGVVALKHNRRFVGIELNPDYAAMAEARIDEVRAAPRLFTPTGELYT